PDGTLRLLADRGVFAATAVDPGTKLLLLEAAQPRSGAVDILDLGCGYGPIALTLARRAPHATVWAVDVNARALELCERNAATAGLRNVRAVRPEEIPADVTFGAIWSNPPIRIGKLALHDLLTRWLGRLDPAGAAYLVAQRHLGADSLQRWLAGEGWAAARITSRSAYRVLRVTGPPRLPHTGGQPAEVTR
ncbi:MAG TPA: methyltransferase, partial [Streptosporangiaceae bacterium]|nr:methyltransferase [Streptosporangiaceae bacterium]